jgi:hypothetical protein
MWNNFLLTQSLSRICSNYLFESLWYVLLHFLPTSWSKPLESIPDSDWISQLSFHFLINFWCWVFGFWVERNRETYTFCTFTRTHRAQDITCIMSYMYLSLYMKCENNITVCNMSIILFDTYGLLCRKSFWLPFGPVLG